MSVYELSSITFNRIREKLVRFTRTHGDRRITGQAIRWIQALPDTAPDQEGTLFLVYTQNKKLLGFLAVGDYGSRESFIVVHRDARMRGIGKTLTEQAISRLTKLYVRVAADNTPSLKTCFAVGMVVFACVRGVTGKSTFWLAGGDWRREDVEIL